MNYLAHLFLSGHDPEVRLGNFIGDVISRKDYNTLPDGIQRGVLLHRAIDTYTDQHPLFKQGVARLRSRQKKYAPVVLDILYDHLLAINFKSYSKEDLKSFANRVYSEFRKIKVDLPSKASIMVDALVQYEYLEAYQDRDGLQGVLFRMDKRAKFPSQFSNSIYDFTNHESAFETEFNLFFPDLIQLSEEKLSEI